MRYSFRVLRKNPGFTLVAALTLALGIGANTAIFSVMNTMLLRPMPFRDPQRLVMVWDANPAFDSLVADRIQTSLQNFNEWRDQNHVFDGIAFFKYSTIDFAGDGKPEQLIAAPVSPGFFDLLGVEGILGRPFTAQESESGKDHVVMLSDSFFERRFAGNPKILGQSLRLSGTDYTIVGILPHQFRLPSFRAGTEQFKPEVWIPANVDPKRSSPSELLARRLYTLARLKPSTAIGSARAEMMVISKRLEEKYPQADRNWHSNVFPLADEDLGAGMRRTLLVLECSVAFVLLIACANVINLQLTRAQARGRELAIRVALGASRWRMAQQMLSESLALSALGGLAGILLANWGISAIVALAPSDIHRLEDVRVDGVVLVFTLAISVLSGLVFGLAPAILAARQDPQDALRRGGRSGGGGISAGVRKALVIAEVALSIVLLAGAGLMIRSMRSVLTLTPGFRSDHLLALQIDLRRDRYHNAEQGGLFVNDLLDRLATVPGVVSAAVADDLPMQRIQMATYRVDGEPPLPPEQTPIADTRLVSDQYIDTMGMTLLAGRGFTRQEAEQANPAQVIINETMARKLWPNQSPIGKVLLSTRESGPGSWRREVIGVVGDSRQLGLDSPSRPEMFFPVRHQFPSLALVVRTAGDPLRLAPAITGQVWAIDKNQPVHDVDAMDHVVDDTVSQRRFNMLLLAFFAGTALVLTAVGIYGVVAYTVSRRTQEIGIRMALGAKTNDVLRLIGGEGLLLLVAGIGLGLTGALALTRLMSSLLFGVSPTDAATFAVVPALLAVVGLAACYLPARRAALVDPTVSLRNE